MANKTDQDFEAAAIVYRTTIKKLEERRRIKSAWIEGGETKTESEFLGYGLLLEGSWEWKIFVEKPPFEVGDRVEVIIRKIP